MLLSDSVRLKKQSHAYASQWHLGKKRKRNPSQAGGISGNRACVSRNYRPRRWVGVFWYMCPYSLRFDCLISSYTALLHSWLKLTEVESHKGRCRRRYDVVQECAILIHGEHTVKLDKKHQQRQQSTPVEHKASEK